jgi:hypothetical protein
MFPNIKVHVIMDQICLKLRKSNVPIIDGSLFKNCLLRYGESFDRYGESFGNKTAKKRCFRKSKASQCRFFLSFMRSFRFFNIIIIFCEGTKRGTKHKLTRF